MKEKKSLAETHPHLVAEWHPTKNGELTPVHVTYGSAKKVWWLCSKGHEYTCAIAHKTRIGTRCPYCSNKKILAGYNDLATTHPRIAAEWHPTLNGELTPQMVSHGCNRRVHWFCSVCGHNWQTSIGNRTNANSNCPKCFSRYQTSFPEQATFYYIRQFFPGAVNRARVAGKELDIYIEELKTGIEYNGWRYHKIQTKKDKAKVDYMKERGIRVITIAEGKENSQEEDLFVYCPDIQKKELSLVIAKVLKLLNCDHADVDLKRDFVAIFEQYATIYKENSLLSLYPEVAKEWHPTQNGSITPAMVAPKTSDVFWWLGSSCGHEWMAPVHCRVRGYGCPICSNHVVITGINDLATTSPKIAKEWHPIKNHPLTPCDVTHKSGQRAWWQCPKGHEWQSTICHRSEGLGCPVCSNRKVEKGYNDLQTTHPTIAQEWHPTKNKNKTPSDVVPGSPYRAWWQCKKNPEHTWATQVRKRTVRGQGCPYCAGIKVWIGDNDLATVNPDLIREWHPTKNTDLTPRNVTFGSSKKVWWQCVRGHEWQATVAGRNSGVGCPYCSGKKVLAGYNDLATLYPSVAKQWHPTLNGALTPQCVASGSSKKAWWKCCKCGYEWKASAYALTRGGCGCPACSNHQIYLGHNDLVTIAPNLANEWHPTRNGTLTPRDITPGSNKKVWWMCSKGHEWAAVVADRYTKNRSCPYCSGLKAISGYNDLSTTHPATAEMWHPTKNGSLTPSDVKPQSEKNVWWWCDSCGSEWQTMVRTMTKRKKKCHKCGCKSAEHKKACLKYHRKEQVFA